MRSGLHAGVADPDVRVEQEERRLEAVAVMIHEDVELLADREARAVRNGNRRLAVSG